MDYFDITPQGMQWLHDELERCKQQRPALIKRLSAAAALGDRSENTEYTESKRDLRHLESRMRYMDKQTRYGQVVDVQDDGVVTLGKTVCLLFDGDDDDDIETYQVVGPAEAEMADNNLTSVSPLGSALMGLKVGDTATVKAPAGEYQVTVKSVALTPQTKVADA